MLEPPSVDVKAWLRASASGQIRQHEIAEHRAVVLTPLDVENVAAEYRAERVLIGDAEHAEGADHHVNVERVDVAAESSRLDPTLEDAREDVQRRTCQIGQRVGVCDVLGTVDVL